MLAILEISNVGYSMENPLLFFKGSGDNCMCAPFTEALVFIYLFSFSRQGFLCSFEPVPELALVDQAVLKLTEIRLPLPPELGLEACTTTT